MRRVNCYGFRSIDKLLRDIYIYIYIYISHYIFYLPQWIHYNSIADLNDTPYSQTLRISVSPYKTESLLERTLKCN